MTRNPSQEQRLHLLLTLPHVASGEQVFVYWPHRAVHIPPTGGPCLFPPNLEMQAVYAFCSTRLSNLSFLKAIYFKMENL